MVARIEGTVIALDLLAAGKFNPEADEQPQEVPDS
jgi:hypothetical protein